MLIHDAYQLQDFQIIGGPKMGEGGAVQPHRNAPAKDSHAAVQPK
jgi:hypothetical protein